MDPVTINCVILAYPGRLRNISFLATASSGELVKELGVKKKFGTN